MWRRRWRGAAGPDVAAGVTTGACGRAPVGRVARIGVLLAGVTAGLSACTRPDETLNPAASGEVRAEWRDSATTAVFVAGGVAGWCASREELLLTAQRGDTGVALLMAFGGEGRPGTYQVRLDKMVPRASLALRAADKLTLRAWRGDSGQVTLASATGELSGEAVVRLATAQADLLPPTVLRLQFRGIPVQPDSGCTPPPPPTLLPSEAPTADGLAPSAGGSGSVPGPAVP